MPAELDWLRDRYSLERPVQITVRGKPEPRGSKQPFVLYKDRENKIPARRDDGSIMFNVTDDNKESKAWMQAVAWQAKAAWGWRPILERETALDVACTFFVRRPDDQYRSGRNAALVRDGARARPAVLPDLDKLARGTLDALTGVVWQDDGLIVGLSLDKRYAVPVSAQDNGQGVVIQVALSDQQLATDLPADLRQRWLPPDPSVLTLAV